MEKNIAYTKDELKNKFNKMYENNSSPWIFNMEEGIYLKKKKILENYINKSKTIIDLGCAEGNFLNSLVKDKKNKYIIGVDIAKNAIKLAADKKLYNELFVGYIDDINMYKKNIKNIDLVLLNEVLYYVDDYLKTLSTILTLNSKYIFISLAIGRGFFTATEMTLIENICQKNGYSLIAKNIVPMGYKWGVELKYWYYIYKLFGKNLKQTHKTLYIFKKIKL